MTLLALAIAALLAQSPSPPGVEGPARPAPSAPQTGTAAAPTADLAALQLQVMLDRAGFSPGIIDGSMGPNTERALALYQQHRGQAAPDGIPPLAIYTITDADTAGPFAADIPTDLVEQAALPALAYRSTLEALAERFHATPELLRRLNPGAAFAAGEMIQVPNVEPLAVPEGTVHLGPGASTGGGGDTAGTTGDAGTVSRLDRGTPEAVPDAVLSRPDVVVTVAESRSVLIVTDAGSGQVVFAAPVTTGSDRDPLPIGEWSVTAIQFNPVFHYNPRLFWDADPRDTKARIQPGPNNPVGLVWIDLDKEHYGIHGTPEPGAIGRTQSHGCVRLTNWDVARLAGLVKPGTRVVFTP